MAVTSAAGGGRVFWMIPGPGPGPWQVPTARVGKSPARITHASDSRAEWISEASTSKGIDTQCLDSGPSDG